ncbi:MAG: hypothetical protein ABII72_04380 [Parcubacteria group bacterium]
MTDKERNIIISNALGLHYHYFELTVPALVCSICGKRQREHVIPDWDSPEGFFKIMEVGITRDWWKEFVSHWTICGWTYKKDFIHLYLVSPSRMFTELSDWLKTREAEEK